MTTLLTSDLIERCHAGSRNKGFWDETPDSRQQLMLMLGELAEAQEADRKGKSAKQEDVIMCQQMAQGTWHMPTSTNDFPWFFSQGVKDTVQDELADAFIRGCDFAGGFNLTNETVRFYKSRLYWLGQKQEAGPAQPENLGAALYFITRDICEVAPRGDGYFYADKLADALWKIQALSDREGIDLATHIDLKLRYNATRAVRHGKAY